MLQHHDKIVKTPKVEATRPTMQRIQQVTTEIRSFQQTPSQDDTVSGQVRPHEVFQLFTASIIQQDKVFIR